MTDPIADMLTRIRNAQAVRKAQVVVPYSKLKHSLAEILQAEGYIARVEKSALYNRPVLQLHLKYDPAGQAMIHSIKRVSKPGRRVYSATKELPYVLNNLGLAIVSTSQGLMTNKSARAKKLGGEIVCEIY